MLPDDLIQGISLRALGASVPGQDMTARVEHEDGVVSDAFGQQSEALLARLDRLAVWPGGEELGITNAKGEVTMRQRTATTVRGGRLGRTSCK